MYSKPKQQQGRDERREVGADAGSDSSSFSPSAAGVGGRFAAKRLKMTDRDDDDSDTEETSSEVVEKFFPGSDWTKFANVRSLCLSSCSNQGSLFPPGARNYVKFPNLLNLKCDLQRPTSVLFPNFDSIPLIPSVVVLKLEVFEDEDQEQDSIQLMSSMCPSVKDLTVVFIQNFRKVGQSIWTHMKQLEVLRLKMDVQSNRVMALDSTFTGYSDYTIQKLKEEIKKNPKKKSIPAEGIQTIPRPNPSILNLTDLRLLEIELSHRHDSSLRRNHWYYNEGKDLCQKEMPLVSYPYAFDLLPKLKVKETPKTLDSDGDDYTTTTTEESEEEDEDDTDTDG